MPELFRDLRSDLRFAFRQVRKNRGVAAIAIFTLALGIGANTAIFSVVDALLIEPLPFAESDRLVGVFELNSGGGQNSVSGGAYQDWLAESRSFEQLAIFEEIERNLTGVGTPERLAGLAVSANFLPTLGVAPAAGRAFERGEDQPGADARIVILTHGLWQSRFGGERDLIGRTLHLDQVPHTVVGILDDGALVQEYVGFLVPTVIGGNADSWRRSGHWRSVIGRLAPGVSLEQADTELKGIKERLNSEYPSFKQDWSVVVRPLQEALVGDSRPILAVLLGTVMLVLLIACANVSNLLLARGHARSQEMAIRSALGAHRWRIVRQLLVESLLLAACGCALGLLFAQYGIEIIGALAAEQIPRAMEPQLHGRVLAFSVGLSLLAGLLFGILPALGAARKGGRAELKESERGATSAAKRGAQELLVVGEIALTLVLLVASGLLMQSFVFLLETDPGFEARGTLAFDLSFAEAQYPEAEDRLAVIEELKTRVGALPGVEAVGSSFALPLSRGGYTEMASRADRPERYDYTVLTNYVGPNYLDTMGTALIRGRGFTEADNRRPAPRLALVDAGLARDLYGEEEPLGQSIRLLGESWEIIGVVAGVRHFVLDREPMPAIYLAQAHAPRATSLVVRTSVLPESLVGGVRAAVREVDPEQPVANIRTMEQALHESLARRRVTLALVSVFALVAIGLACLGIYGMMAFATGQRTRELGIRSALGARGTDLLGLVLKGGLRTAILGIGVGLVAAMASARLIEGLLYQVNAWDPRIYVGAVVLLLAMTLLAVHGPARKAAETDPIVALRRD